jgi:hypothetical protein
MMRTPKDAEENRQGGQVPVEVSPGHPAVLEDLTFSDDLELFILIGRFRTILEQARTGAKGLLRLRELLLQQPNLANRAPATDAGLRFTADWAEHLLKELEKHDPLNDVLAVREDYLGVYQYDDNGLFTDEYAINRAKIQIYWGVVGLVAEWMGFMVEDLSIAVLTHELAHAYTQLGADIDGRRWPAAAFGNAERGLVEGLAQYYTDRVLRRLDRRYGGAIKVYEKMLEKQPEPYRTHVPWTQEFSPEAVRRAMLEVRRWREGKVADFERRLKEAQKELHPQGRKI